MGAANNGVTERMALYTYFRAIVDFPLLMNDIKDLNH